MRIFGFVVPPNLTKATPTGNDCPRYLIAFDNGRYAVIDLEAQDGGQECRTLFNISTGIGGYMPRYITRRSDATEPQEADKFHVTTMCQTDSSKEHYLAHFVLDEECKLCEPN